MLSISSGYSTSYLTDGVAGGREGYYVAGDAVGEPPGRWWGDGATLLGLAGEVDPKLLEAIYARLVDPRDPRVADQALWGAAAKLGALPRAYRSAEEIYRESLAREVDPTPERRAELELEAEKAARQSVMFFDATFNAPKSVSVLGAAFERMANQASARGELEVAEAWAAHQRAVEAAVMAGATASLEYLQDVAGYSRVGHHGGGAGRWTDAHQFVAAQFLQHDSRDKDPHLHVHQAVLNRVLCSDGNWRSLDSRAIHQYRGAAGAIGERTMEAHLSRSLGVRWVPREDGHGREIAGVSRELCDELSSRRRAITGQLEKMVDGYRARYGVEPTAYQLRKWSQQATLDTRSAKDYGGESLEQRAARWDAVAGAAIQGGLERTAWDALSADGEVSKPDTFSPNVVTDLAVASLESKRSSWNESDALRAVSDALPGNLGLPPEMVRPFLRAFAMNLCRR